MMPVRNATFHTYATGVARGSQTKLSKYTRGLCLGSGDHIPLPLSRDVHVRRVLSEPYVFWCVLSRLKPFGGHCRPQTPPIRPKMTPRWCQDDAKMMPRCQQSGIPQGQRHYQRVIFLDEATWHRCWYCLAKLFLQNGLPIFMTKWSLNLGFKMGPP